MSEAPQLFRVWVSRRWWPWPRCYRVAGMAWGQSVGDLPAHVLKLELPDLRCVFIDTSGRTITYGPEFLRAKFSAMERQAGRPLPIEGRG